MRYFTLLCAAVALTTYALAEPQLSDIQDLIEREHEGVVQAYILSWHAAVELDRKRQGFPPDVNSAPRRNMRKLHKLVEKEVRSKTVLQAIDNITSFWDTEPSWKESDGKSPGNLTRVKRGITPYSYYRWPKNILPYKIDPEMQLFYQLEIKRAQKMYERFTCMRFVPHQTDPDGPTANEELDLGHPGFLDYIEDSGCWSYVGNIQWEDGQQISCCSFSTCIHENGHALGLHHEQASPDESRNWQIRMDYPNVPTQWLSQWYQGNAIEINTMVGYDISSYMHYDAWGEAFVKLYPEQKVRTGQYYIMKEVSLAHDCAGSDCSHSTIVCENDGYLTLVDGRCACMCPRGLDPDSGCTDVLSSKSWTQEFPGGSYALPESPAGCADSEAVSGRWIHFTGSGNEVTENYDLKGEIRGRKAEHHFCVVRDSAREAKWPAGNYCIYRNGGSCPPDFGEGSVKYVDDKTRSNRKFEPLPDGEFSTDTTMEFCCRNDGFPKEELYLPNKKPFSLFMYDYFTMCQEIRGMHSYASTYKIVSTDPDMAEGRKGWIATGFDNTTNTYTTFLCHYKPTTLDCGEMIELNSGRTSYSFSISPGTEYECNWFIKAPEGEKVRLKFDSVNIDPNDVVEIRYFRPGQDGFTYSGDQLDKTFISVNNTIAIRLSTYGTTDSQFSATVSLVLDEDQCYNVADRGTSYSGTVNFTRNFEKCLSWSETTHCPFNTFSVPPDGTGHTSLEGNYCRNPDYATGIMPWCYTDVHRCKRDYCDPCMIGDLFDAKQKCSLKSHFGLCDQPENAISHCAKTCAVEVEKPTHYATVTCPAPSSVPDGVVISNDGKTSYAVGETVTYECSGSNVVKVRTCTTSGEWTVLDYVCDVCSDGWSYNVQAKMCYKFFPDPLTQIHAYNACREINADMAMPTNQAENDFLRDLSNWNEVWLPISDEKREGRWKYLNGGSVSWTNWEDGQPNNYGEYEHSAVMGMSGQWEDVYGGWPFAYTCQVEPAARTCKDSWQKCAEMFEMNPRMCSEHEDFAYRTCPYTCGVCDPDDSPKCQVEAAPEHGSTSEGRSTVSRAELVEYTCDDGYVRFGGDSTRGCKSTGQLSGQAVRCIEDCGQGWTFSESSGNCFRFYTYNVTWDEATQSCREAGASLATPKSRADNEKLREVAQMTGHEVWIGLDDWSADGLYFWADSEPLFGWENWEEEEPSNYLGYEDCVQVRFLPVFIVQCAHGVLYRFAVFLFLKLLPPEWFILYHVYDVIMLY